MIILASTRASEAHTLDGDDLPPDIRGGLPALGSFINGMYFGCKALATKQAALFEPLTAKAATMVTDDIFGAVTSLAAIREAAGFLEDGQRFGDHMLHTTVDLLGEISGSFGVGALGEIGGKIIGTVVGSAIGGPVGGITGGQLGSYIGGLSAAVTGSELAQKGCDYILDHICGNAASHLLRTPK